MVVSGVTTEVLVALEGVGKSYLQPNGQRISVLEKINLEVRSGEIIALLGPSGSGKSTLMRMVAGLVEPTEGRVLYRGEPMRGLNPGVAIVFQSFALYPWMTVLENVELGLAARGEKLKSRRATARRMIDVIGLDGFENAYPKELSGGMRQRVGFARALAVQPELLCMDEPFSALDVLTAENLRYELLDLWLKREIPTKAILIVTHGIDEAVLLADRIIVLGRNPGRVRADLRVSLPHFRDRKSPAFGAISDQIYQILTNPEADAGAILATDLQRRFPPLPKARIGKIAGLLELVEPQQQEDLYRIGERLQLEVDDLLPIVEAAQLFGLIELAQGDIALTPRGTRFIDADIDERKGLVRAVLLERVPLMQQILAQLRATRSRTLPEEVLLEKLESEYSPDEAEKQLEVAVDWGRYAELFVYEERTGLLSEDFAQEPLNSSSE